MIDKKKYQDHIKKTKVNTSYINLLIKSMSKSDLRHFTQNNTEQISMKLGWRTGLSKEQTSLTFGKLLENSLPNRSVTKDMSTDSPPFLACQKWP